MSDSPPTMERPLEADMPTSPQELVTIARFTKPEDAHLLCMELDAAGFAVFVQDEYTISMDLLLSDAIGGVRVQVAKPDLEAVRQYFLDKQSAGIPAADP